MTTATPATTTSSTGAPTPPGGPTAAALDAVLGDPADPANPLGHDAFLAADERGDLLPAGRAALEAVGLGAAFVPRELGGTLGEMDALARLLRPLFARDGALALGHGAINLIASAPVWTSGSDAQRRQLAATLLGGRQAAGAYTELATGHDLVRSRVRATASGDGFLLSGRKEVINNVSRAHAVTVLARTGDGTGSRDHSLFLLDMDAVERGRLAFLPRFRTAGLRAMHLSGVDFRDCPVPAGAMVGEPGTALETVLRAFQVTKAVLTSAMVGCLDTQLRLVTGFVRERRLYGAPIGELPLVRSALAGAFTDLLIADCLSTTACRALHLMPRQTSVYAAATKYLVPELVQDTSEDLSVVLGARSFLREGPYGAFQKHAQDLPVASLAHMGATPCQAVLVPQLPRLARHGWLVSGPAPAELFRFGTPLPDADLGRLEITAASDDRLMGTLLVAADRLDADPRLGPLCRILRGELTALRDACAALPPRERTPLTGPAGFRLAERYALLLAAAACLGIWLHNDHRDDPFLTDTAWLVSALRRLTARLGHPQAPGTDDAVTDALLRELLARHDRARAFDLEGRRLW
ncbi:acyl-CoA dehydrogenase [Streptomyces griseoluteus]|uniref:acyl-CoA dehydrogenase n=1 Tax=Streptomyces griseoluteus TaxID=29306 RepID=UPI0036F51EB9